MKKYLSLFIAITLALPSLAQEYGVVTISVCNMKDTPTYSAEMVSQALLGMPVHILQRGGEYDWPQVQTPDGYTGWVHKDAIVPMTADEYHAWNAAPKVVVTALTGLVHSMPLEMSPTISDIVGGDRLKYLGKRGCWFKVQFPDGRTGYVSRDDAMKESDWREELDQSAEAIIATAQSMLGFPYLWGGTSVKGMDCSGFVRTVLFMHDIIAPRDAGPMSRVGARIYDIEDLNPGDLVFFGRWDGEIPRVSHVGIYLGEGRFIHSLGLVKIGSFKADDQEYDAYNTGRYLFGGDILSFIDKHEGLNTTLSNPYYAE